MVGADGTDSWHILCNYSRACPFQEWQNWRPHQIDQGLEDIFALVLGSGDDGLKSGVGFRAPLRSETVCDFAMNDAAAKRLFRLVVRGGDFRIMQKGQ